MGFICTFKGRRDGYQVPMALAENQSLDALITDYYCSPIEAAIARLVPKHLRAKILSRSDPSLPARRVKRLLFLAFSEYLMQHLNMPPDQRYARYDPQYGLAAARFARRYKSDLFVYSPHAWEAFSEQYSHNPRKILFQFHPHHALEKQILREDKERSLALGIKISADIDSNPDSIHGARQKADAAWKLADHIVCASSFTKRSLVLVGANSDRISVIPYGVDAFSAPSLEPEACRPQNHNFRALFVGMGIQRKGMHHLLLAWQRAKMPPNSTLTIVARSFDSLLLPLLKETPNVRYFDGVSPERLSQLYSESSLFVMPSLIEGFGQVYLEALKAGLPVLGTENSGLPDLGDENNGIFTVSPGKIDELTDKLETLSNTLPANIDLRMAAKVCANRFSWARFRGGIQKVTC